MPPNVTSLMPELKSAEPINENLQIKLTAWLDHLTCKDQ